MDENATATMDVALDDSILDQGVQNIDWGRMIPFNSTIKTCKGVTVTKQKSKKRKLEQTQEIVEQSDQVEIGGRLVKKRKIINNEPTYADYITEQKIAEYAQLVPGTPEWKAARGDFDLNASDVAAAVGVSKYKSPYKLWRQKTKKEPEDDLSNNFRVQYGIDNEDLARDEFQVFMALDLPNYKLEQPGITVYRNDTRFAASLDNLAISPDGERRVVAEYKCPQDEYQTIPPHYMIQIQLQMEYAEAELAYFWCWGLKQSRYWIVERNREFFDKWLYPKMLEFSNKLANQHDFEPKRMPPGRRDQLIAELMAYFPDIYQ